MKDRNNSYGDYGGRYPAVVKQYDADRRMCRVEIPGVTAIGGSVSALPWAEIEYPIGDKSRKDPPTEIEMLENDPVWVDFVGGDQRYPIITGYRCPRTENSKDWRHWHHLNISLMADSKIVLMSGDDDGLAVIQMRKDDIKTGSSVAKINAQNIIRLAVSDGYTVSPVRGGLTDAGDNGSLIEMGDREIKISVGETEITINNEGIKAEGGGSRVEINNEGIIMQGEKIKLN